MSQPFRSFVVGRNPDVASRLPYLLELPIAQISVCRGDRRLDSDHLDISELIEVGILRVDGQIVSNRGGGDPGARSCFPTRYVTPLA